MKKRKVLFACLVSGILLIAAALCTGFRGAAYSENKSTSRGALFRRRERIYGTGSVSDL